MNDDDGFAALFVISVLAFAAYGTITLTHMPIWLYAALLFAATELIYIQIIATENENIASKSESEIIEYANKIKIISIAISVLAIPFIASVLFILFLMLKICHLLVLCFGICVALYVLWSTFIHINIYPIKLRIKQLQNQKNPKLK